jgi:hypothetical protein
MRVDDLAGDVCQALPLVERLPEFAQREARGGGALTAAEGLVDISLATS